MRTNSNKFRRYDKPKPNWPDEKPWQKPISRPSYSDDSQSSQAQKWPVERPSWNKYDPQRPNSEIITDDKPANFPSIWSSRPQAKPGYFADRYSEKADQSADGNNWHDYPSRYEQDRPTLITERPNFSHYQYVNNHPPNYPASGDGQWVLLSTNRGYSKSRQRSIKIDTITPEALRTSDHGNKNKQEDAAMVPVMTSRRQVRLDDRRRL